MKSDKQKIPEFGSLQELVDFFDTHDLGDYLERMPEAKFEVNLKKHSGAPNEAPGRSALDVAGTDLNISTQEIIDIIREGRERQSFQTFSEDNKKTL